MKKIISYIIILNILLYSTIVLAVTASYKIELKTTKTNVNPGDKISVTLRMKDLQGMTDGVNAWTGKIIYDKNVFEELTENSFVACGKWSTPTYNKNTGLLVSDGNAVKQDNDIFMVNFKVKDSSKTEITTQIQIINFEASEGTEDLVTDDAVLSINVIKKVNSPEVPDKPGTSTNEGNTNQGDVNQGSTNQGSTNQGSTNQGSTNQGSTNQGGTNQGSTNQGSTNQGGTNQGGTNQGSTNQGSTNQGSTNQGSTNQGGTKPETTKPTDTASTDKKDEGTTQNKLPQTGENDIIYISIIGVMITIAIISLIRLRKYKNI